MFSFLSLVRGGARVARVVRISVRRGPFFFHPLYLCTCIDTYISTVHTVARWETFRRPRILGKPPWKRAERQVPVLADSYGLYAA